MTGRDYVFVVDGELSDAVALAFDGMRLHRNGGTTTLEGRCRDQAELLGTLLRISDLGLTLLSFASTEPAASTPSLPTASPHGAAAIRRGAVASTGETSRGRPA